MDAEIRLNRIETVFAELDYPVAPPAVREACGETVVGLAEGTVSVGEVIGRSSADRFTSNEELEEEFLSLLPRDAVGEPYQSDGDA